jgi:hypothetical protein
MPAARRFPPPWTVEKTDASAFYDAEVPALARRADAGRGGREQLVPIPTQYLQKDEALNADEACSRRVSQ